MIFLDLPHNLLLFRRRFVTRKLLHTAAAACVKKVVEREVLQEERKGIVSLINANWPEFVRARVKVCASQSSLQFLLLVMLSRLCTIAA